MGAGFVALGAVWELWGAPRVCGAPGARFVLPGGVWESHSKVVELPELDFDECIAECGPGKQIVSYF